MTAPFVGRRSLLRAGVLAPVTLAGCSSGAGSGPSGPATQSVAPRVVRYGDHPSQFAELSLPAGTPRGVVVVIHGGFWLQQYDVSLGRPLAVSLVDHGWAAWNVEYRRVGGGGGVPATLDDVAAALDALDEQDVDRSRLLAVGHSAGGQLAAWAAARQRYGRWAGGVPLTGVVAQAGVLDLVAADEAGLGNGAVRAFLGHRPGPADRRVDPIQQVPLDVPVRCVHSPDDELVPIAQSRAYVAAARAAGADADLIEVTGDHLSLIDPTSDSWRQTLGLLDAL